MTDYRTHTPLESRKITPVQVSKYRTDKQKLTMEDHVQQYVVHLKYDGVCGIMFVHPDGSRYYSSRTGEDITAFNHVGEAFEKLPWVNMAEMLPADDTRPTMYKSGVYFGEFWHPEFKAATVAGFNNTTDPEKFAAIKDQREQVSFVVWDFVTWAEWEVGVSSVPYEERMRRIEWMQCIGLPGDPGAPKDAKYPPIFVAPCEGTVAENKDFTSLSEMAKHAKSVGNYDGIILSDTQGGWKRGERNLARIKVKPTITVDLKVVGYEFGKGKYRNVIGKVICEYGDTEVKVSGMTDGQRGVGHENYIDAFFKNEWKGKIIEVEAMEVSAHGKLREPRFKGFREGINGSEAE
ncbi:ATP-dependent DNA ligase [Stenotrophomonas phage Stm18]